MKVVNERTIRDLEYAKILQIVKGFASSLGRKHFEALQPFTDLNMIKRELCCVEELREAIEEGFFIETLPDIEPVLSRSRRTATLPAEDFLPLLKALESSRRIKERVYSLTDEYPHLMEIAKDMEVFRELEGAIRRTIDEKGEIKEDASPKLKDLSNRRKIVEERIQKKLLAILHSSEYGGIIQDALITRRSSRYCIPIKSSTKGGMDWVVQDSSDSGQTLYVEPTSVVEDNNELRELEGEIRDEKLRILKKLTAKVKAESPKIHKTLQSLSVMDFIYAKARYAIHYRCASPKLNTYGEIRLIEARHPLLEEDEVVPIDLSFGADCQGILITGPNTGGKTVCLKTIGLLTLMVQSGIPIPASPDSNIAIFKKIRTDIGDEQSIEQSLSTFSSHISNIIGILKETDQATLVLLDELGAGTDPQEGAALGIGILRFLLQSGAKLAVTTHFSPLKHFAYKHPLLKTCSVDFDVETLSPTYRIVEGVGSSNAFEVAGKLGLPEEIIQSAKSVLSTGELKAEEIIQDLQRERNSLMESKNRLEAKRLEYESRLKELKEDHKRFLSEELSSVEELLKSTKASLKGALHKAHKEEKDKEALRRELSKVLKLSKGLKEAKQKLYDLPSLSLESLHKGERVLLKETRKVGVIKEIIDSERIEIDVGGLRVWAGLCDLAPPPPETKEDYSSYSFIPTSTPKLDLNVRGMTSFDAIREVELYIDRLMMSGISRGYIIHGKGSGKLRSEIRKHLEKNPHVKSFHSPPPHEGGEGITVVELGE